MADISYDPKYVQSGGLQVPAGGFMAAVLDTNVDNISATETWQALSVPAGAIVHEVGAVILTAEGATMTIDIGDGDDADGYLDGINGNSASLTKSSREYESTQNAFDGGKYYASADTIDVLFNNDADTVKILVFAFYSVPRI